MVDEAVGIIGQAVLVVVGLALLAALVLFLLWSIRLAVKLCREIWPPKPNQPYTDAYIAQPFDQTRRN
jgi:steroid 5-alpha reductase family enzyme